MWHTVEFSRFGRAPLQTLSGRFWGNPSNLLPLTHLVNSPCWRVSKLEGLSIVPLIGRASDRSFGTSGVLSLVRSVAFFSPPRALPSLAARKTLRGGYGPSQIAGISGVSPRYAW